MKIIHCADIHLGASMNNLNEKTEQRKRELLDTFFNMIRFAKNEDVKVIIIAGDLFDKASIKTSYKKEIFTFIKDHSDIKFLYLLGNHDAKIRIDENLTPSNLILFNNVNEWNYYNDEEVCVASIDIEKQPIEDFYPKLDLNKKSFNIVVLHGKENELQLTKLKNKSIDYIALGDAHTHKIEKLDNRAIYAYSGCLEGKGYDEIGKKGFVMLDTNESPCKPTFHSIAKRQYVLVLIDITNLDAQYKIEDEMNKRLESINKEFIVRVELVGKMNKETQINLDNLREKLITKVYYGDIKDSTKPDTLNIDLGNEISLRSEFIKLVKASSLPEKDKAIIILYGWRALHKEEINK